MSTALYRRYRPDDFAEMIGQEHVTGPLMQALRSGRVNHAYLFSGPRGCGKTTSARILARCLNCAEGPTPTPCGTCDSCVELARGGSGSLDVVEIDAASHGGVDDARDLRERATFAPVRDRYKIFILDEAHMVTSQGFNALLKIVEEPPPHIKFIFATTEPDKVIGTIRSRTHHYPFRLVPPDVLGPYLEQLCGAEGVSIGAGVVPLVTRAGGGSVRDSLSVMDQLIAGADDGAVDYERAVALLGYTHAALLDDVVDALAVRDGASIFRVVDHVVASGHEPRRFVEDLLERLRDLVVMAVSGDAADAVLRDVPPDQLERMRAQARNLGLAELSRAADLVNAALTEMTGATSPRLHLELLCARLLVPSAEGNDLAARLDRLERDGVPGGGGPGGGAAVRPADAPVAAGPAVPDVTSPSRRDPEAAARGAAAARAALQATRTKAAPAPVEQEPASAPAPAEKEPVPAPVERALEPSASVPPEPEPVPVEPAPVEPEPAPVPVEPVPAPVVPAEPEPEPEPAEPESEPAEAEPEPAEPEPAVPLSADELKAQMRSVWGAFMAAVRQEDERVEQSLKRDVAWEFDDATLRVRFRDGDALARFDGARGPEIVRSAVARLVTSPVRVEVTGPPAQRVERVAQGTEPAAPRTSQGPGAGSSVPDVEPEPADPDRPGDAADAADAAWLAGVPVDHARPVEVGPGTDAAASPDTPEPSVVVAAEAPAPDPRPAVPVKQSAAAIAIAQARQHAGAAAAASPRRQAASPATRNDDVPDDVSDDDPDLAASGLVGVPLIVTMLGGQVVEEIVDEV